VVKQLNMTIATLGDEKSFGSLLFAVAPSGSSGSAGTSGSGSSSDLDPLLQAKPAAAVQDLMVPAMLVMLEGALLLQNKSTDMLLIVLTAMLHPLNSAITSPACPPALVQQIVEEVLPELVQLAPWRQIQIQMRYRP